LDWDTGNGPMNIPTIMAHEGGVLFQAYVKEKNEITVYRLETSWEAVCRYIIENGAPMSPADAIRHAQRDFRDAIENEDDGGYLPSPEPPEL